MFSYFGFIVTASAILVSEINDIKKEASAPFIVLAHSAQSGLESSKRNQQALDGSTLVSES